MFKKELAYIGAAHNVDASSNCSITVAAREGATCLINGHHG